MDKINLENKEARIHPKQWESVLKSKQWTDDELDTILALLVVEISHMADFIKGYKPMWTIEDCTTYGSSSSSYSSYSPSSRACNSFSISQTSSFSSS